MAQDFRHLIPDYRSEGATAALPSPQVEVVTLPGSSTHAPPQPWYRAWRLRVFIIVFLALLLPGLGWDFLRPAQYRATASLLTAVQLPSSPTETPVQADVQHATIQRQMLLGRDLLEETLETAAERTRIGPASADDLRPMLAVALLADTNLVELSATGDRPAQLAVIVNSWIQAYRNVRQRELERDVGDRQRAMEEELAALTESVEARRLALERFRAEQDIVTLERDGNQALARLNALTQDLNSTRGEAVEAEARLASIQRAVARGDPIVPRSEQGSLDEMEARALELRAKLIALRKRFTVLYLANEPELQVIPAQLEALEAKIAENIADGRARLLVKAEQELEQAQRRVEVLGAELLAQKGVAARFTTGFTQYQAMEEELTSLQEMSRTTKSQLVELAAKGLEKYPPVEVIEAAYAPVHPIYPHYWRDAGLILLSALTAGLFAVLLLEFLTRRPREHAQPAPITGVRVFSGETGGAYQFPAHRQHSNSLERAPLPGISGDRPLGLTEDPTDEWPRELTTAEAEALWELADPMSKELLVLLLSGLTIQECAELQAQDLDLEAATVQPAGGARRPVPLADSARDLFAACQPLPLWASRGGRPTPEQLSTRIGLLAHDARLDRPMEVDAESLRHSYIAYLVRQGVRLTELELVIGPMAPSRLARYASLGPQGPAISIAEANILYPALKTPEQRGFSAVE